MTGPRGEGPMTGRGQGIRQPQGQAPLSPQPPKQGLMTKMIEGVKTIMEKPKSAFNEYDIETDKYGTEEQKKIVDMVVQDITADTMVMAAWKEDRKKDLQRYNSEKPSVLRGLKKKAWMSDMNMGITGAVTDSYDATLLATTYNPDSIHYVATEKNDLDNKANRENFAKWAVGKNEMDFAPQADDFIHTKTTQGYSIYKVRYEWWFDWIDRMIPQKNGKYKVEVEKKRFERVVVENKNNLDDILVPRYGNEIQKLPHIIDTIHLTADEIKEYRDNKAFTNADDDFIDSVKGLVISEKKQGLEAEKAKQLSLNDVVDEEMRALPIDIHEWYGWYTKNGRREKYRFRVHKATKTFLAGKPLRRITPESKYPFVGGPFIRIPGQLKGHSMPHLIKDPSDALDTTFNQKRDFQYVTNCPFGFHKASEGYTKSEYALEPGISYPTEGNPHEEVSFPNLQRSMAWAESDIRIMFEIVERKTGAASYFQSTARGAQTTATRDTIVEKNSQTRFGRWVTSIQGEHCEALSMAMDFYAKFAPKNLAERVLGEDGKQLFPNFSRETLRYRGDARMEPDIVAGSKSYERQLAIWGFQNLQQSVWFNPQINPQGNWQLTHDVMKKMGFPAPDRYLPPKPKQEMGTGKTISDIWARLIAGEIVEVDPSWNLPEVLAGLYKKKGEGYFDLDKEYRPNLDKLIFQTETAFRMFVKQLQEQEMANNIAKAAIAQYPQGPPQGMQGGGQGAPPAGSPAGSPAGTEMPATEGMM